MSDLARQAAEEIVKLFLVKWDGDDVGDAASAIRLHGTLVSHEDAELLRRITCLDPLTLERAVEVMGCEPDSTSGCGTCIGWECLDISVWTTPIAGVRAHVLDQTHFDPTVGQFACLVLAAKQG